MGRNQRRRMFSSVRQVAAAGVKSVVSDYILSVHVTYGRGSVLLWRQCNMLCTSGFVDDIMFSHNGANWPASNTDGGTGGKVVCYWFEVTLSLSCTCFRHISVCMFNVHDCLWHLTVHFINNSSVWLSICR